MSQKYDVIVVGLGAVGSSTVYQLASSGARVLGVDQFNPPHGMGSSVGETRITRQAIGEGEFYVPLVLESYKQFEDIEKQFGTSLLRKIGGLLISTPDTQGVHGKKDFLGTTIRMAQQYSIRHDVLNANDIRRRFPQFSVRDDNIGYYEYGSGYLRPEKCIEAQLALAKQLGADIKTHQIVSDFKIQSDNSVTITSGNETYHADKIIFSVGSWVAETFPRLKKLFNVVRQVQYWFDCARNYDKFGEDSGFPVFIWDFGNGDDLYGFPAVAGSNGGVKISGEVSAVAVDPHTVNRTVEPGEAQNFYKKFVKERMPDISGTVLRTKVCMYTITPDHDYLIDFIPETPQVMVVSPCSGHGFKNSAGVGRLVSQMATGQTTFMDPTPFSLKRFASILGN